MRLIACIILSFAVSLPLVQARAQPMTAPKPGVDAFTLDCRPTPSVGKSEVDPKPSEVPTSNNLLRKTGMALHADGQKIILKGRLLDEHCLPIEHATIDIWQSDAYGVMMNQPEQMDPHFQGAGRTVTDNEGYFTFITVFPGPMGDFAPHIHYRVKHALHEPFVSTVYFKGDRRNTSDPDFSNVPEDEQPLIEARVETTQGGSPMAVQTATFRITLQGGVKHYTTY